MYNIIKMVTRADLNNAVENIETNIEGSTLNIESNIAGVQKNLESNIDGVNERVNKIEPLVLNPTGSSTIRLLFHKPGKDLTPADFIFFCNLFLNMYPDYKGEVYFPEDTEEVKYKLDELLVNNKIDVYTMAQGLGRLLQFKDYIIPNVLSELKPISDSTTTSFSTHQYLAVDAETGDGYGVSSYATPYLFQYRASDLTDLGISKFPETWDGFKTMCEDLYQSGNVNSAVISMGANGFHWVLYSFFDAIFTTKNGYDKRNQLFSGDLKYNSDEGRDALQELGEMTKYMTDDFQNKTFFADQEGNFPWPWNDPYYPPSWTNQAIGNNSENLGIFWYSLGDHFTSWLGNLISDASFSAFPKDEVQATIAPPEGFVLCKTGENRTAQESYKSFRTNPSVSSSYLNSVGQLPTDKTTYVPLPIGEGKINLRTTQEAILKGLPEGTQVPDALDITIGNEIYANLLFDELKEFAVKCQADPTPTNVATLVETYAPKLDAVPRT